MKPIIFILYDSITNSVFNSQVLQPLLEKRTPAQSIHIISFERDLQIEPPFHEDVTFFLFKRYPFIHRLFLQREIRIVRHVLERYTDCTLIARGPFAGYIARKAADPSVPITVQARGLVADEYRYVHKLKPSFLRNMRYAQLYAFEKTAYASLYNSRIESVSAALDTYLIQQFNVENTQIKPAVHDIPPRVDSLEKERSNKAIRKKLNIAPEATVYCYSGSCKAWQCPDLIFDYFKQQLNKDPHCILLVLSTDVEAFKSYAEQWDLPHASYLIIPVKPQELISYLCSADYGLLFREPDIINYVARPTKALEYQAAGLPIIHNGTVAYLETMPNTQFYAPQQKI